MSFWKKSAAELLRKADEHERRGDERAEYAAEAALQYGLCIQLYGRVNKDDRPADWNDRVARVMAKLDALNT